MNLSNEQKTTIEYGMSGIRRALLTAFGWVANNEKYGNLSLEEVEKTTLEAVGNESALPTPKYGLLPDTVSEEIKPMLYGIMHLLRHPKRREAITAVYEILDVLKDDNHYVSIDNLKSVLDEEDFKFFMTAFNLNTIYYESDSDHKGLKEIMIDELVSRVTLDNVRDGERHLTKEQIFIEYVEYYKGYEIEIDPEIFSEIYDRVVEECTGYEDEFPLLGNVSKREEEFFYAYMRYLFKELLKVTKNEYLITCLKRWLE